MLSIDISVEGLEKHLNLMRELEDIHAFFDPPMARWAGKTKSERLDGQKNYPAELPHQTYVRTGHLGDSFDVLRVTPSVYRFRNDADYADDVIGDSQKGPFIGRWWTFRERIEDEIDQAVLELDEYLQSRLRYMG